MPKNVIERILKERLEFSITGTVTEATSRQRELIGNFETLKSDYFYLKNLQRSQQEDLVLLNTAASIDHTEQAARQVFEDQLNDIVRYPNGRLMLSRVEQLIRTEDSSKPFKVLITDHGHNEYNFESNKVILNFWDKTIATQQVLDGNVKLFSVYPVIQGQATDRDLGETMVVAKDGLSPFFISAFHEFNHYLDHKDTSSKLVSSANEKLFPEEPGDRIGSILRNSREHRAIFDGDPDSTSELRLRMEAGEPIRYLYQPVGSGKILYEPINTVFKHASYFASDKKPIITKEIGDYLRKLPLLPVKASQAYARHMEVRLAPFFGHAFRDLTKNPIDADFVDGFLKRTKPQEKENPMKQVVNPRSALLPCSGGSGNSSVGSQLFSGKSLPRPSSLPSSSSATVTDAALTPWKALQIAQVIDTSGQVIRRYGLGRGEAVSSLQNPGISPLPSLSAIIFPIRTGSSTTSSMRSPFTALDFAMPVAQQRGPFLRSFSPPARSGATALPPPRRASTSPVTTSNSKGSFSPSRWKG